jgi:hypothetical protein
MFRIDITLPASWLAVLTVCSTETLVFNCESTWNHNQGEQHLVKLAFRLWQNIKNRFMMKVNNILKRQTRKVRKKMEKSKWKTKVSVWPGKSAKFQLHCFFKEVESLKLSLVYTQADSIHLTVSCIGRRQITRREGGCCLRAGRSSHILSTHTDPASSSQDLVIFVGSLNHRTHRRRLDDRGSIPGRIGSSDSLKLHSESGATQPPVRRGFFPLD